MKKIKLFKTLLVLGVILITSVSQMWAGSESLNHGNMHYTFNDATDRYYDYNKTDYNHKAVNLGTLTGSFTITSVSFQFSDDWGSHGDQTPYLYLIYSYDNWATKHDWQAYSYSYDWTNYWVYKNPWGYDIATSSSASGNYSLKYYWELNWKNGTTKEINNNTDTYEFTYTVMPPDVSSISVSATGAIHGEGTEGNPYIVPYGGTLQLDITSAAQEHTDANSSAQYSVDNTNWGTETENTQITFENITSTTNSDWMVYARFHNGTASLTGNQLGKRIYYRAEDRYDVTSITASPTAGGTVSPASASSVGQYSGVEVEATPYVGYRFNGWSRLTGSGSFDDASSASTTFNPTADATIQAAFIRTYAYIEGRFKIQNEARNSETTTYGEGNWNNYSTDIQMTYESANKRFSLHTYMTPAELSEDMGKDIQLTPYFYIKLSTSSSGLSGEKAYRPNEGESLQKLTTAGFDNGKAVASSDAEHSLWFDSEDESGYVVLYFNESKVWYEVEPVTFTGAGGSTDWDDEDNWSPNVVPTSDLDVMIEAPVVVSTTSAVAKSVKIYNDGDSKTGKLTIGAGSALIVAEDIKKTTDGRTKIATTADVLHIEAGTSSVANGALVWGTEGTPGKAQVDFYTKSHGEKNSGASINQYIGTPFSDKQQIHYQYYYSWMYKIARDGNGDLYWDLMDRSEGMNPYEGYDFISAYDAGTTYQLDGTLVSNANKTLTTSTTPALVYSGSGDGASPKNENVLANSWVAPIKIASMDAENNFSHVEGSIYIFNAGTPGAYTGSFDTGTAGNYTCYTIGTAGNNVIPSMQSFSVFTNDEDPEITFNYNAWVKTPLTSAYNNSANKAPRRSKVDEMKLLKVRVQGENGWADEVKIYTHEEFSMDFEDSWDGHKMYGYPETPQLYAVSTDGALAISCVPTADNNVLGFTPGTEDSEYTFSFNYDGDEELLLKDTKTNIETPISNESEYKFTADSNDSDMRFVIRKVPAIATSIEDISGKASGVQKILHNGTMYIVRDGKIYTATGNVVK